MILKKLFFVVLSAVAIFSFDIQAASEKTKVLYPENNCGTADSSDRFSVVGFKNYPPFSWVELDLSDTAKTSYNYKGFIFDSVRTSLNDMKIQKINNLVMDSVQQIQKAVLHGKTDMFFMSYYVDEAKSGADYIYPAYFGNPFVVVSRASKKIEVDDISGLKGLKGVIRREEEIEALISGLLPTDTKMEVVDGAETAFRKLLSGDVDFMITSPYAADAEVRRFKIKNKVHFGKKVLRHIKYFIAFSKLSVCRKYKDAFAQQFAEQIKDKSALEKKLQDSIRMWADKFADDPPLQYTPPEGE